MFITFIKSLRWDVSWAAVKLVAVLTLLGMSVGSAGAYCFSLFLKHPLLGNMAWLYGRMDFVSIGAWLGGHGAAWLGALGFMLAEWRNPALIQPAQLNKTIVLLVKSCLIGIAICVINGGRIRLSHLLQAGRKQHRNHHQHLALTTLVRSTCYDRRRRRSQRLSVGHCSGV